MGGGITAGYQLRLNKALDLDFNLGLGYLNADYWKIKPVLEGKGEITKEIQDIIKQFDETVFILLSLELIF